MIRAAPTAADLFHVPRATYLDFPGSPLDPGCSYEQWADQIIEAASRRPRMRTSSAQRGKPGKLALQYWLYYVFNDWNNKHESDWEMIQLMFDASHGVGGAEAGADRGGVLAARGGGEGRVGHAKLQKQACAPIVFPGRGSHANYFEQASGSATARRRGSGATTRPPRRTRCRRRSCSCPTRGPRRRTMPFRLARLRRSLGPGGERSEHRPDRAEHEAQWTEPVSWSEDEWRDSSTEVPSGSTLGPARPASSAARSRRGSGSTSVPADAVVRARRTVAVTLLGIWLSRRTAWSPARALPDRRVRCGGQIYRAALQLYRRYRLLFLGIGLIFIPLAVVAALQQALPDTHGRRHVPPRARPTRSSRA